MLATPINHMEGDRRWPLPPLRCFGVASAFQGDIL
jgi:hypothetical protein